MSNYSVSCDGVAIDEEGALYILAVYTDGESFTSHVHRASDVAARSGPNVRTELLAIQEWLIDIWRSEAGNLYVTDAEGNVRRFDGTVWTVATVSPRALTCIWGLSDAEAYTADDEGVIYRWDGTAWAAFSPPLGGRIFSIRGLSGRDLYACGAHALFWHFDGAAWTRIELPTNQRLLGLLPLQSDDVLVCGQGGVLFRGAGAAWMDVSQPGHYFHGLALYRDTIYIAGAGEGVFAFDGVSVSNVKDTFASYVLTANAAYLASAGGTAAVRFDGKKWFGSLYS